jgi:hypothetical protein
MKVADVSTDCHNKIKIGKHLLSNGLFGKFEIP